MFSTHNYSPTEASLLLRDLRSSPRAAIHIQAKPPVRADGSFFLTAISYDNRMFSDVFGPHFPRVTICQQGRCLLLRDLASSPRAHSLACEAIGPDGAFPRPQSVATAACSTILPAHIFHAQLFTNGGKSSVARPAFFSPHGQAHPGEAAGAGGWIFLSDRNQPR